MEREKQGHLGNLQEKTLPQLLEILHRQEKLLSKQKLLATLPDNGQKVRHLVETLQQLISQRQTPGASSSGSSIHTICDHSISRLGTGGPSDRHAPHSSGAHNPSDFAALRESSPHEDGKLTAVSLHRNAQSTAKGAVSQEEGTAAHGDGEADAATAALADHLEKLAVSESAVPQTSSGVQAFGRVPIDDGNLETLFQNSYENVMKRSAERDCRRKPFKPNSSLKISDIQQLPEALKLKSRTVPNHTSSSQETARQKAVSVTAAERPPEESAVHGPVYRFSGAKEISIQDSISLQRQQKKQLEKIQTLHAAERLAERLIIKTGDYERPTADMDYRNCTSDNAVYDSDDISDEEDT